MVLGVLETEPRTLHMLTTYSIAEPKTEHTKWLVYMIFEFGIIYRNKLVIHFERKRNQKKGEK
jgi:hypothetical protein